jgi:hypothetical protein
MCADACHSAWAMPLEKFNLNMRVAEYSAHFLMRVQCTPGEQAHQHGEWGLWDAVSLHYLSDLPIQGKQHPLL